ncbi:MAG: glucose-6-phosphate dehydrogenase assembly protein OpcA [Acidobacteria bacterium]|nr:glucose-6-phosphate dehydrogenase assembly protein OpcA [Acidobacteriota bacterium]
MKNLPQRAVDVSVIEHELKELWEQMTEVSAEEDQQAVMRACVANLVVVNPAGESAGEISPMIAEVTNQHPSRVILLLSEPGSSQASLDAMVTAQCHPSGRGRKQICCEQIVIQAAGEDISRLPSLVRTLVIPDLPVFLWWRDLPDFQNELFTEFIQSSDRVILDSTGLEDAEEGLRTLASLMDETAQTTAFSDLTWCRLTPWRVLVAGFFDVPKYRPYLARLDRVQIESVGGGSSKPSIPAHGLLLAAWLASRLNWKATTKPHWIDERTCDWELEAEDRTVTMHIKITSSEGAARPGLNSLQLLVEGEPSAQWVASIAADGKHLEGHARLEGRNEGARLIQLDDDDEAQLVGRELEILGHDQVYEQGLKWLVSR